MRALLLLGFCLYFAKAVGQDGATAVPIGDLLKAQPEKQKELVNSEEARQFEETVELQMIEVTGSYIKRVDEEGPSPVKVITQKEARETGQSSVADVFREGAFTNQDIREDSLSSNPGVAAAGIGIFDAERVLTLLDGQRLPKVGGSNYVDLNLIPMSAIERVEILKDGASATYGSDAIGGVMNFITKKNFTGGTVSLQQTSQERGEGSRGNAQVSFGRTYKKGSILVAVERKDNSRMTDQSRDYSRITNVATQGSAAGNFGTLTDLNTGDNFANPDCPAGNLDAGGICRYDYTESSWNLPDIGQTSVLVSGEYKFNKHLKSKTTLTAVQRRVEGQLAPPPNTVRLTVAQAESAFGSSGFTAGGDRDAPVLLRYRLVDEAGPRRDVDETNTFFVAQKFHGKIKGSWTWDVTGSFAKSIRRNTGQGYANSQLVVQSILDGSHRPFDTGNKGSDLSDTLITRHLGQRSEQSGIKAVATGTIYNGGKYMGPIAWAIGGSLNWQRYSQDVDSVTAAGNNWGGIGNNGQGSRAYQGLFQEIAMFPTDNLEIGFATRFDNYSDFGNAVTPKVSLAWTITENFLFRSSLGAGFRAPNLGDLYRGDGLDYPTFVDVVGADAGVPGADRAQQYERFTQQNQNLLEERSRFFNMGFVAQPKKNWSLEANYFYAKINDGVGTPSSSAMIRLEKQMLDDGMTAQEVAAFFKDAYNVTIERASNGALNSISVPAALNVATERLHGIDLALTHQGSIRLFNTPIRVFTRMEHQQFLNVESESFPGDGMRFDRNIDWKNTASVTGLIGANSLRMAARTVSGGDTFFSEVTGAPEGSLPTFTAYDLSYTHGKFFGGAITAGIKNVFNDTPPLDETEFAPGDRLDRTIYDIPGRIFFANLDYAF